MSMLKERGVPYALISAIMLGVTPILGKQAMLAGLDPLALVAGRTVGAAGLLLLVVLVFKRSYLTIYPIGLAGCLIAGALNGTGSLFFYAALARNDAGISQLLFSLYPILVAFLLYLDGRQPSPLTVLRLAVSLPGIYLVTQASQSSVDPTGVLYVLIAALFYALHIPINQRVLYEAPAPTVTLYTLLSMTAVVLPAYLLLAPRVGYFPGASLQPLLGLTLVTFTARLALFAGVKLIGGVQTSLFGLAELLVTILLAHVLLGEDLSLQQWLGGGLIITTLLLAAFDRTQPTPARIRGWLYWLRSPLVDLNPFANPSSETDSEPSD
jgi:drug/metabolite transporter (DMT)-like permease